MRIAPLPHWAALLSLAAFACSPAPAPKAPPSADTPPAAGCPTPPDGMLHLYIARHGQTDWNAERRLQGQSDRHLNDLGRAQAARLAERLRGVRLDRVYSSTLARSRETAEAARGTTPLEGLDGLREQALGKFEGLRLGEGSAEAAEFERRIRDANDGLDGGESGGAFYERVRAAAASIVARHRSGTVLVVAHGGTNKMLLRALLGLSAEQADAIRQANDEVYKLEIAPGQRPQLWKAVGAVEPGEKK